jgi:hypothetical protein
MMLDKNGETLLVAPAFYQAMTERWKNGALS